MKIWINDKLAGKDCPCFIIAEIGSNHNGKLSQAKRLIDKAKKAGADCAKFQTFKADELVAKNHPAYQILKRLELPEDWHYILSDYCKKKNILFASTPFYVEAIDTLRYIKAPFIKISSGDITYFALLKKAARTKSTIFLSTGASTLSDISKAIEVIRPINKKIILLHCVSAYPPRLEDLNLRALKVLSDKFGLPVGFSDHTRSLAAVLGAVSLGACVIERHFTISRRVKGPDHFFAMEPDEFKKMVNQIRELEVSLGKPIKTVTKSEIKERRLIRRKKCKTASGTKYLRLWK